MTCSRRQIHYILALDLLITVISISSSHQVASPKIKIDLVCLADEILLTKCFHKDDPKNTNEILSLFPVYDENNTLVVDEDQEVLVGITCTASFPVEWIHIQEQWLGSEIDDWLNKMRAHSYSFKRTVKTLEDVSSFTYQSTIYLQNIRSDLLYAIGRYTCQSSESSTFVRPVSHMSVFTKRKIYEKTLPLSGRNVTVWNKEQNDGTIIFPCYASYPKATVNLYKKGSRKLHVKNRWLPILKNSSSNTIETWDIIQPSDKLNYRADQGFIYHKRTGPTIFPDNQLNPGNYKCVVVDEDSNVTDEEPVMINLQEGYAPVTDQSVHNTVSRGAFVNYTIFGDQKAFSLLCCSSSPVPPDLYLVTCTSKTICESHQRIFSKLEVNVPVYGANLLTTVKDNCRKSLNISYAFDFPVNLRCIGDGLNYSNTLIFPLENDNLNNNGKQPYEKWEDIDPLEMVTLKPQKWDKRSSDNEKILLYNNQNITFHCVTNLVYFALGSRITISFQNGTRVLLDDVKNMNSLRGPKTLIINFTAEKDVESISCHAPVLNSNQWITKTVKFQVMDGEVVNIMDSNVVNEIYWTLNDKSKALTCQFSGDPKPEKVEWRKDDQVIQFTNNTNAQFTHSMDTQNTSILLISLATYDTHGVYECVIGNIYGNVTKEFRVIVRAPESSWIIFSASLGLIFLATILIILGLCMWRQRKHLNVLMRPYEQSVD